MYVLFLVCYCNAFIAFSAIAIEFLKRLQLFLCISGDFGRHVSDALAGQLIQRFFHARIKAVSESKLQERDTLRPVTATAILRMVKNSFHEVRTALTLSRRITEKALDLFSYKPESE